MSDVWISRKKWTCPYCDITINDDVPSRMQHEGGLRHKGNVERALKDVYRKGERSRRDEENAKREMAKIEKAAMAAHAQDLAGSSSSAGASSSATAAPVKKADEGAAKPAWKPSDKLSAYSSAADLGLAPAEEETAEQKAAREEAERRLQEGLPGEWEVVAPPPPPLPSAASASPQAAAGASSYVAPQTEKDKARTWKAREKAPVYLDGAAEDEALDAIKVRKRIKIDSSEAVAARQAEDQRHMLPQWRPMALVPGVKKQESEDAKPEVDEVKPEPAAEEPAAAAAAPDVKAEAGVKKEEPAAPAKEAEASPAPAESRAGGMFKKRKAGTGAGAKRVRAA